MKNSDINLDKAEPASVLYVEDNAANIVLMQDIFSEFLPYSLTCVSSAEEGIELVRKDSFNLILMDLNLEGMNGLQALEIIQNDEDIASTPVIAISADAITEQINKSAVKGFVDYIVKPYDLPDLIKRIKQHLGED